MKAEVKAETIRSRESGKLETREVGIVRGLPPGETVRVAGQYILVKTVELNGTVTLPVDWIGESVGISIQQIQKLNGEDTFILDWDLPANFSGRSTLYWRLNKIMEKVGAVRLSGSVLSVPTLEGAEAIFELLAKYSNMVNLRKSHSLKKVHFQETKNE